MSPLAFDKMPFPLSNEEKTNDVSDTVLKKKKRNRPSMLNAFS